MVPARSPFSTLAAFAIGVWRWRRRSLVIAALVIPTLLVDALTGTAPPARADDGRPAHVLVIGIDGLSLRAMAMQNTPTLNRMIAEGAAPVKARAVMPTMSAPNWATHLMGAGPRRHGIRNNAWRPERWEGHAMCGRPESTGWPTIFEVIRTQRPDARISVFHDWIGIGRFVPRGMADRRWFLQYQGVVVWATKRELRRKAPEFTFIQLDEVDAVGHRHGWDSWQYHRAVAETDAAVAEMIQTLDEADLLDETLIMVVSDHGGRARGHGGGSDEERDIPWIIWGHGVVPGLVLEGDFTPRDTAPTIAHAMGIDAPDCWTGRAVTEAFDFQPAAP